MHPVFVLDPHFDAAAVGINRFAFLLDALRDLHASLVARGSGLILLRGRPEDHIPALARRCQAALVTWEADSEPYARARDATVANALQQMGVAVAVHHSHTLRDLQLYAPVPRTYEGACDAWLAPLTDTGFLACFRTLGPVRAPIDAPAALPPLDAPDAGQIPTLHELGFGDAPTTPFRGGESEALSRLARTVVARAAWVAAFAKPDTAPNSLEPSTTVLSPYLKFGCLSAARFFHVLADIYAGRAHTQPPVSLHGQLMWREYFYAVSAHTVHFDRMAGNPLCRAIAWDRSAAALQAWAEARTGFPFIDAAMTQLRVEGWLHHLARHAVACFLTRGDLWQHWEDGARVFDRLLLDADWALNNANWMWLSCSAFFHQYWRVYSPVAFGQRTDPQGAYIRKWLPPLAHFPAEFIYAPWTAPLAVQRAAGCMIGADYPHPIVDHKHAAAANLAKMKLAFAKPGAPSTAAAEQAPSGTKRRKQP